MTMIFDQESLDVMKRTRNVFNPDGLLNPGKIFPTKGACTEVGQGITSTVDAARRIDSYVIGKDSLA